MIGGEGDGKFLRITTDKGNYFSVNLPVHFGIRQFHVSSDGMRRAGRLALF